MARHLVLFAKAPRFATVKTRLAGRLGPVEALRFHRAQLGRLGRTLGGDRRWTAWMAVSPDTARGPWTGGLPVLGQGRGDLGRRMAGALAAPPAGPVVLIGSDVPAVRPDHVARAFALLETADIVFGPAEDGGFWLVGVSRRRPLPDPFAGARWSTPDALADCLANLPHARVALADRLADVDG
jgi:rSAM/selenodomain-associated transferase 1